MKALALAFMQNLDYSTFITNLKLFRAGYTLGCCATVGWEDLTNLSEVITASIIKTVTALMMDCAARMHGATTQKAAIFTLAALWT
jgi:hypothetical protein